MIASAIAAEAGCVRISGLVPESIVDGPGLRMAVFTQGCPHHCPGCHNPETHALTGGTEHDFAEIISLYSENPLLSGITFSGGEPFLQAQALAELARLVHDLAGDIVTYTGYTLEQLLELACHDAGVLALLSETDILVDGPFIKEKASLEIPFRGSSNQRLLHRREFAPLLPQHKRISKNYFQL